MDKRNMIEFALRWRVQKVGSSAGRCPNNNEIVISSFTLFFKNFCQSVFHVTALSIFAAD